MLSSIRNLKFLLDENIKIKLFQFLRKSGFDVKLVSKGSSDKEVASISKAEKRILITNDDDFCEYSQDELFAVIWLKIPQGDTEGLLRSFQKLLKEFKDFSGQVIMLEQDKWTQWTLFMKMEE